MEVWLAEVVACGVSDSRVGGACVAIAHTFRTQISCIQGRQAAFVCKKRQGETAQAELAEGMVMDVKKYGIDDSFCYLDDMLSTGERQMQQ